jgi:hypothetical protein
MKMLAALLALGLTTTAANAAPTLVYSNDFTSTPTTASGVNAAITGSGAVNQANLTTTPQIANYLRNRATNDTMLFTFTNLGAHTSIDIDFTLLFIDSWDGVADAAAPDYLDVTIDGKVVATYSVNNVNNNYASIGGGTQTVFSNFTGSSKDDRAVDFSSDALYTFAHSASTLTLGFRGYGAGYGGGSDESYGVDNLVVRMDNVPTSTGGTGNTGGSGNTGGTGGTDNGVGAVPEPATWMMMLTGFGLIGAACRRRRSALATA